MGGGEGPVTSFKVNFQGGGGVPTYVIGGGGGGGGGGGASNFFPRGWSPIPKR